MFAQAEANYLEGISLSPAQRALMEARLCSAVGRDVCIACGALLRDPATPRHQKKLARKALRKLCLEHSGGSATGELSVTLLLVPFRELDNEAVRRFAYEIIRSERFTLRANAVMVLQRFAEHGDKRARALLQLAVGDENPKVRENATIAAQNLRRYSKNR